MFGYLISGRQPVSGNEIAIDPINLKFGSNSRIEGSNSVKIYTDEGGTIDMTQLKEGAISAKVITILTKARNNEGGNA